MLYFVFTYSGSHPGSLSQFGPHEVYSCMWWFHNQTKASHQHRHLRKKGGITSLLTLLRRVTNSKRTGYFKFQFLQTMNIIFNRDYNSQSNQSNKTKKYKHALARLQIACRLNPYNKAGLLT